MLTKAGHNFVTPMSLAALSEDKVYTDLFDLKDEAEMGHIQLSRQADLVVVAPATADLMAKMAQGIADDLATTLAARDRQAGACRACDECADVAASRDPAQCRDAASMTGSLCWSLMKAPMACGEFGPGRLPEPEAILGRD